ncbi:MULTISPECIES: DNA polymerase III subunit beta [Rhodomicrobium]|uniref:DNA polymerase III subunit beta n=1 Tax=Rhodomicrobium TaxID=1068 RepID=UPI001482EBC4|nr:MULTISPECIES: DNA polymerase III subunit beta [Rhodomicrobium]
MTVERDVLLKVLSHAAAVPETKNTIPILNCLVIGTDGEGGFVRATDTDLEICAPFEAHVIKKGSVAAPARLLADIVKRMPSKAQIAVSIFKEKLRLVCGNSKFDLGVLPADDYPFPQVKEGPVWRFEIEAERLRSLFAGVRHAIANDETRFYLNGIYLHVTDAEPSHLRAVATNGHMLAMVACEAPPLSQGMAGVIVPKKTIGEMMKLLPTGSGLVTLTVSSRLIGLELAGGWMLSSKLIEGTFPDYPRVIPTDNPHRAKTAADSLAGAIDRIATLCDADHAGIVMIMKPGGPITIAVDRAALGSGRDLVGADTTGQRAAIGINHRYMAAILASLSGATLEVHYNSSSDPVVFRVEGSEDSVNVLSPMKVDAGAESFAAAADMLDEAA